MMLQRGLEPRRSQPLGGLLRWLIRFAQKRFAFGVRGSSGRKTKKQTDRTMAARLFFGAPAGTRTPDTLLKRQVLYLLSYWGGSMVLAARLPKSEPNAAGPIWKGRRNLWFLLTPWLGWRDSNPLYRSQSPVCYHYTTSHRYEKPRPTRRPRFFSVGWDMGLEPTTPGTTIRCSAN